MAIISSKILKKKFTVDTTNPLSIQTAQASTTQN
jgi:hypothetical protein